MIARPRTESENAVTISHLGVTLGKTSVLRDINLAVECGAFVGIIGENGAGKTTLLRVLLGLIPPNAGSIEIFGKPVRRGGNGIGYVPQRLQLDRELPMRARDFVGLGLDGNRWGFALPNRTSHERIDRALEAVSAHAYSEAPVGRLSGGEAQRLFIAQALLAEPKLLLLDEPLSNLDLRSASDIVELIHRVRNEFNVTVLLVTHDVNPLMRVMDSVIYLANGNAAYGPISDVINTAVLSRLYGYPVEVIRVGERVIVLTGTDTAHGCSTD